MCSDSFPREADGSVTFPAGGFVEAMQLLLTATDHLRRRFIELRPITHLLNF
jgi:hypothetical protein